LRGFSADSTDLEAAFYCYFCWRILPFLAIFFLFLASALLAFCASTLRKVPYLTLWADENPYDLAN
jgi:hypothetical protein